MTKSNKITERDIFNFVFQKEQLSASKQKEISANYYYRNKISFFNKLKVNLGNKILPEIKAKLSQNIPIYKPKETETTLPKFWLVHKEKKR